MLHPQDGERVHVQPNGRKVQRGEHMYGQFIASEGEELLWDQYLHQRLTEGAITWRPIAAPPKDVEDATDPA